MALAAGSRVGSYEILSPLGAGGMGEVYRARDSKLHREVAIKVLPDLFANDADRLARFQREALVLASLNHPHIAQIYGIEDSAGTRALIMELVEGPTLADRIAAGPLPLDEALAIAKSIAEALEAAHEQGIVHRDLKPANVKVRPDGTVKVLDFGLAKPLDPVNASAASAMVSPTVSMHATQAGMLLGTAAYMSPEQARGKLVDRRADIWAFGVVLFEMLAGRHPFAGEDVADLLAEIQKREPAWSALPASVPPGVQRLLRRSLQKDSRQRLQHIGDARLEIEEASRSTPEPVARRQASSLLERLAWLAALVVVALGAVAIGRRTVDRTPPAPAPDMSLVDIDTPFTSAPTSFALSPDGRAIVFTTFEQNKRMLCFRSLDTGEVRLLAGSDDGLLPFWSPDSRSIGFFNIISGKLMVLDLDGRAPRPLASVLTPAGGTWNADGTILYVPVDNAGIFRIPASGGDRTEVVLRQTGKIARFPQFLPDGQNFLFFAVPENEQPGVYVATLGKDEARRILSSDAPAFYGSGKLLFVQQGALLAQAFDPATQQVSGTITHVADDVALDGISVGVSTSRAGSIAYRTGGSQARRRRLVWYSRSGTELGTAGDQAPRFLNNPSLSRDGKRLALQATDQQNTDIYVLDLERNAFDRVTIKPGIDSMPVWSPDGKKLVFNSGQLTIKHMDGSAPDEPLGLPGGTARIVTDWSPDGRYVLYKEIDPATATFDLFAWQVGGGAAPIPVARSPYSERDGQFAPNGRAVVFQSDELGRPEIYLQPFPGPGPRIKVSIGGGTQVRWRQDGKELFYVAPDNRLMAVAMDGGREPKPIGAPVSLFQTRMLSPPAAIHKQQYVVSPDGKRFLINTAEATAVPPITLVLNWKITGRP